MISKFLSLKCKQATESLRMLSLALQWTLAHLRNLNASDDLHGESFDSYVSTCAKFAVDKRASFVWPFSNNLICFMIYNFIQLHTPVHNPVTGFVKWILQKQISWNRLNPVDSLGLPRWIWSNDSTGWPSGFPNFPSQAHVEHSHQIHQVYKQTKPKSLT